MWRFIKPNSRNLRAWQLGVLVAVFVAWHLLTTPGLLPPFLFADDRQAAFFFGEPLKIFGRVWGWFIVNADIYKRRFTSERSFAWIDKFRALLIRFDRKAAHFLAAHHIAFTLINLRHVFA